MRVNQALLEEYRRQLDGVAANASDYVAGLMAAMRAESPGASVAELREAAIAAIDESLNAFGDQAAELARELFEAVEPSGEDSPTFEAEQAIDRGAVSDKVRYAARKLVEGNLAGFDGDVRGLTEYYVRRTAFENLELNCERNGLRYARVPSGRETCGFCLMLSSRGFAYRSEATAAGEHGYHEHCDCVIVPGLPEDGPVQIEGYDPAGMRRRLSQCEEAVGGEVESRRLWAEMGPAERARYKGEKDWERFRRFHNARVRAEAETRDFRWLNTGRNPEWEAIDGAKPDEHEKATAERLSEYGWKSRFRPTRDKEMLRTSDAFFVSGGHGAERLVEWDFKNPVGGGGQTLYHQLEEAAGQTTHVVIDLAHAQPGILDDEDFVLGKLRKLIRYTYKVKHGRDKGKPWKHDEVIVLLKGGAAKKIAR